MRAYEGDIVIWRVIIMDEISHNEWKKLKMKVVNNTKYIYPTTIISI